MDRLDSGFCVRCGSTLLDLQAPLQMCSECQKWAEQKAQAAIKNRKNIVPKKRIKIKSALFAKAQNA